MSAAAIMGDQEKHRPRTMSISLSRHHMPLSKPSPSVHVGTRASSLYLWRCWQGSDQRPKASLPNSLHFAAGRRRGRRQYSPSWIISARSRSRKSSNDQRRFFRRKLLESLLQDTLQQMHFTNARMMSVRLPGATSQHAKSYRPAACQALTR